jgi:hypothetical protein
MERFFLITFFKFVSSSRQGDLFTLLLQKDANESKGCSHKKAVSNLFVIVSKGHAWINPGDDIDYTAVHLWLRI